MTQTRRMLVLRAVVEDYIRSQEPVGSSSLTQHHKLGVSPATIRNEMSALEDDGYLVQPHTSAGRIPTEKGYRYFVDRLAAVVPLSQAQKRGINNFLSGSVSLQDILQRSARLLASITGQVAVVASPALSKSTLRHIEIIPVSANTLLLIVITDTGSVAQHTLNVNVLPDSETLRQFTNTVNIQCSGLSLNAASEHTHTTHINNPQTQQLAEAVTRALKTMADGEVTSELYMAGTSSLAHQRTVADLAPVFDALEEQVVLMKLMSTLSEETNETGVSVAIGSETHTPGLLHASVVTSGYGRSPSNYAQTQEHTEPENVVGIQRPDTPVAFVGSIGLTHMDYAATMAAVRAVARYLTEFISQDDIGA